MSTIESIPLSSLTPATLRSMLRADILATTRQSIRGNNMTSPTLHLIRNNRTDLLQTLFAHPRTRMFVDELFYITCDFPTVSGKQLRDLGWKCDKSLIDEVLSGTYVFQMYDEQKIRCLDFLLDGADNNLVIYTMKAVLKKKRALPVVYAHMLDYIKDNSEVYAEHQRCEARILAKKNALRALETTPEISDAALLAAIENKDQGLALDIVSRRKDIKKFYRTYFWREPGKCSGEGKWLVPFLNDNSNYDGYGSDCSGCSCGCNCPGASDLEVSDCSSILSDTDALSDCDTAS